MRKILASIVFCAFAGFAANAQNLNPEVQVTNDYKAEMGEAGKGGVAFSVPDSLVTFRTDVNYSITGRAYKGAYDFNPYEISMVPDMGKAASSRFWLRAGAGYSFHPVLQAVFTPAMESENKLWVYQDLRGYAGNYSSFDGGPKYKGYDFGEKIGVAGRFKAAGTFINYDVNYNGVFTDDFATNGRFHLFGAEAWMRSPETAALDYSVKVGAGFGMDGFSALQGVNHTSLRLEGRVHPDMKSDQFEAVVDADLRSDFYSGDTYRSVFSGSIIPRALFAWDTFKLSLGAALSPGGKGLEIYPAIDLSAGFLDQLAYLSVTGGQHYYGYADLKLADHWFNPQYTGRLWRSRELVDAKLGVRGNVSKLQYDLSGGYSVRDDMPMSGLVAPAGERPSCTLRYADYNMWHADLLLAWKSGRLDADGGVHLRRTNVELNDDYLDLPLLECDFKAVYNWNRKVFAGVRAKAASARECNSFGVDGYFDLGLYGEYRTGGSLSVWAQASNLLDSKIATAPVHIRNGIYFTAGICLDLR